MSTLYYLQDSRSFVGNCVMWWAKGGNGYTSDLSRAETYTLEAAMVQHRCRPSDVPWPKDYVDARTAPTVDAQKLKRADVAVWGDDVVVLTKDRPPEAERPKCEGCGRFMSESALYLGPCAHCGEDNRP